MKTRFKLKEFFYLSFFVFFLTSIDLYSQNNTFLIGSKEYPCTEEIRIGKNSGYQCIGKDYDKLTLFIVKNGNKGMMAFKNSYSRISGTITIYLDDNTLIKLIDRKIFDYVDNIYTSVYYLTNTEIEKLKDTNIRTIRYNINNSYGASPARTAPNEESECWDGIAEKRIVVERIDFSRIVNNLFNS